MPLQIVKGDITKIPCDAIVNAEKPSLLGGTGVNGAIRKAAGVGLSLECMIRGGCKAGQAKITKGYKLPSRFVIHTGSPKRRGGSHGEREQIASCYTESLKLAYANGCSVVAFPLIPAGDHGYSGEQALQIATDAVTEFLSSHDMLVYIVVFDPAAGKGNKTKKSQTALLVVLAILILLLLLGIVFRDSIEAFIQSILQPIGPGGMVDRNIT